MTKIVSTLALLSIATGLASPAAASEPGAAYGKSVGTITWVTPGVATTPEDVRRQGGFATPSAVHWINAARAQGGRLRTVVGRDSGARRRLFRQPRSPGARPANAKSGLSNEPAAGDNGAGGRVFGRFTRITYQVRRRQRGFGAAVFRIRCQVAAGAESGTRIAPFAPSLLDIVLHRTVTKSDDVLAPVQIIALVETGQPRAYDARTRTPDEPPDL